MKLVDSRSPDGPGILSLRDHRSLGPEARNAILAATVKDRDEFGVYEVEDYGDLCNASAWPNEKSRPMPGWGFAWSVLTTQGATITLAGPGGKAPAAMLPAHGQSSARVPDSRFKARAMGYPPTWPAFPHGWTGIAIAGTDEDVQRLHWHPTDPRLVSPHRATAPQQLSSIVTDCAGFEPDLAARLATHLFVVNKPRTANHGDDKNQGKVGAWYPDAAAQRDAAKLTHAERNVFGFNPPTLSFPQTPGFSASGQRLEQNPSINEFGDVVYGNADAAEEAAENGDKPGQHDNKQPAAGGNAAANEDEIGWAAYNKAVAAARAAGKGDDEAALAGQKARNAAILAASASGALSGKGAADAKAKPDFAGPNSSLKAGDDGGLGENSLAWLVGWSNGFHGGFVVDNEPPSPVGNLRGGPLTLAGQHDDEPLSVGGKGNLIAAGAVLPFVFGPLGSKWNPVFNIAAQGAGQPGIQASTTKQPGASGSDVVLLKDAHPVPLGGASNLDKLGIRVGKKDGKKIVALVSANYGGFLHTGDAEDVHEIGKDADGNPINPAHISMNALFYHDHLRDGPLSVVPDFYQASALDYVVPAYMAFDSVSGRWKWWATAHQEVVPPYDPPYTPYDTPNTPYEPPWDGRRPVTMGMDGSGRTYVASAGETAYAVILGRPQDQTAGGFDYRVTSPWLEADRAAALDRQRRAPVVGRIEAYGAQKDGWTRTTGEQDIYRGGTAPGGFAFMPPESRIEDLSPVGVTKSTAYLVMAAGSRFGFGTPLLGTGGMGSGWSMRLSGSDLVLAEHIADGTLTDRLKVSEASGHVTLQQLVANKSIKLADSGGNAVVEIQGTSKLGFYGATPAVKPTVSGSRADTEGALKDLLAELATLGLIVDSTTAS